MFDLLIKELSALEEVEAIALGGSRAGEVFDSSSDYDVYLYCTAPVAESVRCQILSRYCSIMEIGNHYWELEDNCVLNNGIDIDILYRDLDSFTADVAAVVEQHHARNGYTTCMWHNLRTCKILYDKNGRLQEVKTRFDVPYPDRLQENIISRNFNLLQASMPAYRVQIVKAIKRRDLVSINHRVAAFMESYFDILFALNQMTHPGEKRQIQLCKEHCTILPANFEENINRLFFHMYTAPEQVEGDISALIGNLRKIL